MKKRNTKSSFVVAIIPARGGSKSIPQKNLIHFCGKPLIAWTIENALKSKYISEVFVTTDNKNIGKVSEQYGAKIIWRPAELATDVSSSETAILHAIAEIEKKRKINAIVFLQATSPLREATDIDKAFERFISDDADSLFSAAALEDFCVWKIENSNFKSITFNYKNRGRRQDRKPCYLENGSIYIFKPNIIRRYNNRLGGKISFFSMPFWKSYEIDKFEDIEICKFYMTSKILKKSSRKGKLCRYL